MDKTNQAIILLKRMKEDLGRLEQLMSPEYGERSHYTVLKAIDDAGGIVTKKAFKNIGKKHGYDIRGLSRLYGRDLRLIAEIGGDKVGITPKGLAYLKERKQDSEE